MELFSNLSDKTINYSWKLSGIKKFNGLESEKPSDLDDEQMLDDVNERLEELELLRKWILDLYLLFEIVYFDNVFLK